MQINIQAKHHAYPLYIERGSIAQLPTLCNLCRQVLILSDDGVPTQHIALVESLCPHAVVHIVKQGEGAKSLAVYEKIVAVMLKEHFSRKDLLIAVGGGVIGDLGGFVAATYMRGIEFINIPTTTLAQIDSSIGGKVALNVGGIKNCIGAFYPPIAVFIDCNVLKTLPLRHFNSGLAEALKAGLIADKDLFTLFEGDITADVEAIILRSLLVKKHIVEIDETELKERKLLNFGHTIGHAIESYYHLETYYHGECVALGMLHMISDEAIKQRLLPIYKALALPHTVAYDAEEIYRYIQQDKKAIQQTLDIVLLKRIGEAYYTSIPLPDIKRYIPTESAETASTTAKSR